MKRTVIATFGLSLLGLSLATAPIKVLAQTANPNQPVSSQNTVNGVRTLDTDTEMPALPNEDVVRQATGSTVESVPLTGTPIQGTTSNNSISLTAIPPRVGDDYSLTLKPGEQRQILVEIRNPSSQSISVASSTKDFILGGEDGETPIPVDDPELSGRWSLASWLTLDGTTRTLEPKQAAQIPVLISVPADALPGGHYAMILHRPTTGQNLETTGSQINTQIGTLVYVIVDGPMQENLNIVDFAFDHFREKGPVNYKFTIENDSSYHLRPEGQIEIKNALGQVIDSLPINTNKNIFPDTQRQYAGVWEKGWGFGPYTATLILNYGQDNETVSSENTFWLMPVRILIIIVLALVIIVAFMIGKNKKNKKPKSSSSNKRNSRQPKSGLEEEDNSQAIQKSSRSPVTDEDTATGPGSHRDDNDLLA